MKKQRPSSKITHILHEFFHTHSQGKEHVRVCNILDSLENIGNDALIILFTLPFCLPIAPPGISTPLGFMIILLAARSLVGYGLWLPQKIKNKQLPRDRLYKWLCAWVNLEKMLSKISYPRWLWVWELKVINLVKNSLLITLALFLSLPIPIPLTNLIPAWLIIGLVWSHLIKDGLLMLCTLFLYFATLAASIFFFRQVLFSFT